jgi:hypothetical protein
MSDVGIRGQLADRPRSPSPETVFVPYVWRPVPVEVREALDAAWRKDHPNWDNEYRSRQP